MLFFKKKKYRYLEANKMSVKAQPFLCFKVSKKTKSFVTIWSENRLIIWGMIKPVVVVSQ